MGVPSVINKNAVLVDWSEYFHYKGDASIGLGVFTIAIGMGAITFFAASPSPVFSHQNFLGASKCVAFISLAFGAIGTIFHTVGFVVDSVNYVNKLFSDSMHQIFEYTNLKSAACMSGIIMHDCESNY